jgi:hypothetical protein
MAARAAAATAPVAAAPARAATSADTIVMGKGIDDIATLDPVQACEFTSVPIERKAGKSPRMAGGPPST